MLEAAEAVLAVRRAILETLKIVLLTNAPLAVLKTKFALKMKFATATTLAVAAKAVKFRLHANKIPAIRAARPT